MGEEEPNYTKSDKELKFLLASSWYTEGEYEKATEKLLRDSLNKKGLEVKLIDPTKVQPVLSTNLIQLYSDNELISDSDILIVKRTRNTEREMYELATAMEILGKVVVDPAYSLAYPTAKFIPQLKSVGEIPCPKSAYFSQVDEKVFEITDLIGLQFPYIIKPQAGKKGEGVELVNNEDDVMKYASENPNVPVIVQEYLDTQEEYRVLVIGENSLGACRKISEKLAKNVAQGATMEYLRDENIEKLGILSAKARGGDIHGVDIVRTKDNALYLLEHNRNPNFVGFREASGIAVEDKIIEFCIQKYKKHQ